MFFILLVFYTPHNVHTEIINERLHKVATYMWILCAIHTNPDMSLWSSVELDPIPMFLGQVIKYKVTTDWTCHVMINVSSRDP